MNMRLNFKNKRRLINGSRSWGLISPKEVCATKLHTHSLLSSSVTTAPSTNTDSPKIKVHKRTFRHSKWCGQFQSKLLKRYRSRFKKPIHFRINGTGRSIEYYI